MFLKGGSEMFLRGGDMGLLLFVRLERRCRNCCLSLFTGMFVCVL